MLKLSRCKNCGGEVLYSPQNGALVCERCGSNFPVKENGKLMGKRMYSPSYMPEINTNINFRYNCSTCGAKSIVGTENAVKRCSSCGSTTLTKEQKSSIVPEGIIPFTISRRQAGEIFRKWVSSRSFAPSDLKQMARLEKISGLYTPVWNFSFTSTVYYSAIGTNVKTDSNGFDNSSSYPISKVIDKQHENVLKSGSSRMSNSFIAGVGAYDFNKTRPYSTDYLLGFAGMDTDIDVHSVYNDMTKEITSTNRFQIKCKLENEYDAVENFTCRTTFKDVAFNYAYVPIWANHYRYKGKEYHCYINGQTGKATGKAPKSFAKIGGLVLGILTGIAIVIGVGIAIIGKMF